MYHIYINIYNVFQLTIDLRPLPRSRESWDIPLQSSSTLL